MSLFDKTPEVSMTGTEYIRYLDYKKKNKKKLTEKQKQGFTILILCGAGILIAAGLINHLTYKEPVEGMFDNWYESAPDIAALSWNGIAKVSFGLVAPILLIVVAISWILHGVQLRILA